MFACMDCVMPSKGALLAQELVLFAAKHQVAGSKCSCGSSILIAAKTHIYRDLRTVKFYPRVTKTWTRNHRTAALLGPAAALGHKYQ